MLLANQADESRQTGGVDESAARYAALMRELADHHRDTASHAERVGTFAGLLAREAGLSSLFADELAAAARLHDIGKLGVDIGLLMKEESLNAADRAVLRRHTVLGHNILRAVAGPSMVADVALCHHERWDGFGYPHRVRGNAIPLAARLTSIADVYDAMRSARGYKDAFSHAHVAEVIVGATGQFDPDLVSVFARQKDLFADAFDHAA